MLRPQAMDPNHADMDNKKRHAPALEWMERLTVPHALVWVEHAQASDQVTAAMAVRALFADEGFPASHPPADLLLLRDPLGKPCLEWQGTIAAWAAEHGYQSRHLHITNTHDGGAHIILAAYHPQLAGIGIDAVYLPRLRGPGKPAAYLRRFAAHFMSAEEQVLFALASAGEEEERLRLRVAAHFSLMEAASKALGTGLKIGGGMGRPESLPKQSLGARSVAPQVEMLLGAPALQRMDQLGATRLDACWSADPEFLVSAALLWLPA
jgi:phosphopantetheinyl transferase (holo-ACP synthase)